MRVIVSLLIFLMITLNGFAQNVGIGTNTPNSSALLDLTDTTRGILIPRMTKAQRLAIQSPANGLMVYQTDDSKGLWIFNGLAWSILMELPGGGSAGKFLTYCRNGLAWTTDGICQATITSLECAGAQIPEIQVGSAQGFLSISYKGAQAGENGGATFYRKQIIPSAGITGLNLYVGRFPNPSIESFQDGLFPTTDGTLTWLILGETSESGIASFEVFLGGQNCILSVPVYGEASVSSLNCESIRNQGVLYEGIPYSGEVISRIPYTGGNGGIIQGKSFSSSGVSGLAAVIDKVRISEGDDSLTIRFTGQANQSGIASFALDINGTTCTLTRTVNPPATIGALKCEEAEIPRLDITPIDESSNTLIYIPYSGGDGGLYPYQIYSSTGVTGLNLLIGLNGEMKNGTFANGDGFLVASLSGTPSGGGAAQFALNIGGQTCTLSIPIYEGTISSINCAAAGIPILRDNESIDFNIEIPVTGGDGGIYKEQIVYSTGVTELIAYIGDWSDNTIYGVLPTGDGVLPVKIEGFPSGEGIAEFALNIGGQSCTLQVPIYGPGTISSLDCQYARGNGTLEWGKIAVSDTIFTKIPYTGTNAGYYNLQTFGISSGTVSGVSALLNSGYVKAGNDSLTIYFQGLPKGTGEVSFELNILGQTCIISRTVNPPSVDPRRDHSCGAPFVHNGELTYGTMADQQGNTYKTIQIGTQEWMAENLRVTKYRNGEDIVSVSDEFSLEQEGNQSRGAYCSPDFNAANDCPYGKLYNWYAVSSTKNLCPEGWHVPSYTEWETLEAFLGTDQDLSCCFGVAGKMINTGTNYWQNDYLVVTNASGFSALPAGFVNKGEGFSGFGRSTYFWGTNSIFPTHRRLTDLDDNLYESNDIIQSDALSVRCVKD